ncbi:MAG: hypothetical protein JNM19_05615 [Chitinophagaceae bacterium]|nr:hypothetical protein [Chitinophagaceae bacterium]
MRSLLSERNIVVVLFVLVLITFSLAQEDSKKMEQLYSGSRAAAVSHYLTQRSAEMNLPAIEISNEVSSPVSE